MDIHAPEPERRKNHTLSQRLIWAIPVSVVVLLVAGWFVLSFNLRSLRSLEISAGRAFQESQLHTANAVARQVELYTAQANGSNAALEEEIYQQLISTARQPNGSAWLITPRHIYLEFEGLLHISARSELPHLLLLEGQQSEYRSDTLLNDVQEGRPGSGWCVWQEGRGPEAAAWDVAQVGGETWVVGYSLPLAHILTISGVRQQTDYMLALMLLTSLGGLLLTYLATQTLFERQRAEAKTELVNRTLEQRVRERTLELARINVRLSDEIDKRSAMEQEQAANLQLLEQLNRMTHAALEASSLEETLNALAEQLPALIQADACYITLYDEEENCFRVAAAHGFAPDARPPDAEPGEVTLSGNALRVGQPLAVSDTTNSPLISARLAKRSPRALLALPLLVQGQGLGAILLGHHHPHSFSEAEIRIGEQAAAQVSLAILKARLLNDAQQRAEQLSILYEIGLAVSSHLELDTVLQTIYEQCRRALQADAFYLALYDQETNRIEIPIFYDNQTAYKVPSFDIHERQSLTGWVIQNRRTVYLHDTLSPDEEMSRLIMHLGGQPTRSFVSTPLMVGRQVVGVLSIQSYQPAAYRSADVRLLETIAAQAAIAIENARSYQQVEWKAIMDELTSVYNRRGLFLLGQREVERSTRTGRPLSILFMDVDEFRDFNNRYNYNIGDIVLQAVGAELRASLRSMDIVGRYGGDEFVVLLPETDLPTARSVAERLRQNVAALEVLANQQALQVTISIGIGLLGEETPSLQTLLNRAGDLLHHSKAEGRNRISG